LTLLGPLAGRRGEGAATVLLLLLGVAVWVVGVAVVLVGVVREQDGREKEGAGVLSLLSSLLLLLLLLVVEVVVGVGACRRFTRRRFDNTRLELGTGNNNISHQQTYIYNPKLYR
jgi:uncharacterized membrane protein YoaK (UPF0700 family)